MDPVDHTMARAMGYPYRRPAGDFCFDSETATVGPLVGFDPSGRVPVLAVGSNAAPEQLARKFEPAGGWGTIPVTTARLVDHDVVFAARLTPYGACPATFVPCSGVVADVHVTWLTPSQLARMDVTEGAHLVPPVYRRLELAASVVELECSPGLTGPAHVVWAYEAIAGALYLESVPCALAAIEAAGRVWPALTERSLLARLAEILGVTDAETVARTAVADAAMREHWNRRLAGLP